MSINENLCIEVSNIQWDMDAWPESINIPLTELPPQLSSVEALDDFVVGYISRKYAPHYQNFNANYQDKEVAQQILDNIGIINKLANDLGETSLIIKEFGSLQAAQKYLEEQSHDILHCFSIIDCVEDDNKVAYCPADRSVNNIGYILCNRDILQDAYDLQLIQEPEEGVWAEYEEDSELFLIYKDINGIEVPGGTHASQALSYEAEKLGINKENINRALKVLIDNGIDKDDAEDVLQALGYTLLDSELFSEDNSAPKRDVVKNAQVADRAPFQDIDINMFSFAL